MHEAAITQALVEQIGGLLPEGAVLVECLVEVGELEHIDAGVMRTMWEAMILETPMVGAALRIESVALAVRCGGCGDEFVPEDRSILICPSCGVVRPEVLAGVGVVLRSLEIEESG